MLALAVAGGGVVRALVDVDRHAGRRGRSSRYRTRAWELAVGGLVALTAGAWRHLPRPVGRAGGLGRSGVDRRHLHTGRCDDAVSRYDGVVAGARNGVGDRRGLCDTGFGCRALLVEAGDARRSVGCRTRGTCGIGRCCCLPRRCSARLGLGGPVGDGRGVVRTRDPDTAPDRKPRAVRGSLTMSAQRSLVVGGVLTAVAVCVCVVLLMVRPVPVGHGTAARACCSGHARRTIGAGRRP